MRLVGDRMTVSGRKIFSRRAIVGAGAAAAVAGTAFALRNSAAIHPHAGDPLTLNRGNGAEPDSLDPHKAAGGNWENNIIGDMFIGLMTDAADASAIPGAAESYTVSHDGLVYTLGAVGHLFCFEAKTGKVVWSKDLIREMKSRVPEWGFAGSPLIDGNLLIVTLAVSNWGTEGGRAQRFIALDKKTGETMWVSNPGGRPYDTAYAAPSIAIGRAAGSSMTRACATSCSGCRAVPRNSRRCLILRRASSIAAALWCCR